MKIEVEEPNGSTVKPTAPTSRPIIKPKPKPQDVTLNIPAPGKKAQSS